MKPVFLVLLVSAALLLGGCLGDADTPATTPTATRTPGATATIQPTHTPTPTATTAPHLLVEPADLQGVSISLWHPYSGAAADALREMVNDFNSENEYGINVEVYSMGSVGSLQERMYTPTPEAGIDTLQSTDLPQVVIAPQVVLRTWADADLLMPLDDYLQKPGLGFGVDDLADVDALALQQSTIAGELYSLPLLRNAPVLFYNHTWAQELGFDAPPATLAEFSEQACAAQAALLADADPENDYTGGWIVNYDENTLLSWLAVFGVTDVYGTGEAPVFNTPAAEEAFAWLWQLNNSGCAWSSRQPTPYDYFATRRALLFSAALRDTVWVEGALNLNGSGDEWRMLPYPAIDDAQTSALLWDSSAAAVVRAEPEQQLAGWLFAAWLLEGKNQAVLAISTNSFPARESAWTWLDVYSRYHPQWAQAREWMVEQVSVPLASSWLTAGNLLEDAGWQLFQPYTTQDQIPFLLETLDNMIEEFAAK